MQGHCAMFDFYKVRRQHKGRLVWQNLCCRTTNKIEQVHIFLPSCCREEIISCQLLGRLADVSIGWEELVILLFLVKSKPLGFF